jgi:hypothetical protein
MFRSACVYIALGEARSQTEIFEDWNDKNWDRTGLGIGPLLHQKILFIYIFLSSLSRSPATSLGRVLLYKWFFVVAARGADCPFESESRMKWDGTAKLLRMRDMKPRKGKEMQEKWD